MKIYKNNPLDVNLGPLSGLFKPAVAIVIVVVLVLLLTSQGNSALHARLVQNPISLTNNDSTMLYVGVVNPENTTVNNVVVSLTAPGSKQLSLYPAKQTIQTLGPQEERKLEFLISPIDAEATPFLPGTYRVDISTQIAGKNYQTSVFVSVEK